LLEYHVSASEISTDGGVLLFPDRWLKYCRNKTISGLLRYHRSAGEIGGGWWSAFIFGVVTKGNGSISPFERGKSF
jgi:hypothetical protein